MMNKYLVVEQTFDVPTKAYYAYDIAGALEIQWREELLNQESSWIITEVLPRNRFEKGLFAAVHRCLRRIKNVSS